MFKSGQANLPLHPGKAPRWLFKRMVELSGRIAELIIDEYGHAEFLRRISNPLFFQSLGCVIGFDWHSSGLTTTTCAALKQYLLDNDLGLHVAGGKGKLALNTLQDIDGFGLPARVSDNLSYASRLIAKIDNSAVQDGYSLYHHSIFFDSHGNYAVVQQGLCNKNGYARRYHWLSFDIKDFVNEPHEGVCGTIERDVLDLTNSHNHKARKLSVDMINDNPERIYKYFEGQLRITGYVDATFKRDHYIRGIDLNKKDKEILNRAYELQPRNYEELVLIKGMGPKKLRALALAADLVYGAELTWKDPVKYSFAHGGKDGIPYPVDRKLYDDTVSFMDDVLHSSDLFERNELRRKMKFVREMMFNGVSD